MPGTGIAVEKLPFYNHTLCECVEKAKTEDVVHTTTTQESPETMKR